MYLGIRFSTTGSFLATKQMLADQARKATFKLYQYRNSFVNISPTLSMELFDRLIAPILCYGSEVCGHLWYVGCLEQPVCWKCQSIYMRV